MVSSFFVPVCCRRRIPPEHHPCLGLSLSAAKPLVSSFSNNSTFNSTVLLAEDKEEDIVETSTNASSQFYKTLKFRSSFEAWSDPLPPRHDVTKKALTSFFVEPSHFSFGPSIPSTIVPITPELYWEWTKACQRVGATSLPTLVENGDHNRSDTNCNQNYNIGSTHPWQRIMSVRAARFSMLGLTVEWSALMGAQVLQQQDGSSLPYLEFVLIKDQSEAWGSNKPLLWMYNKITGFNNNSQKETCHSQPLPETMFLSRFGFAETVDEQKRRNLSFQCTGTMEMMFPIPSMVGRMLLGSSSTKMQQQVNRIITREIEKDLKKAMVHWQENFRKWAEKNGTIARM
jgi:hypothetical protein